MEKCSVCKVARYCNTIHSIEDWDNDRFGHKVMCPLLKRWRRLQMGKGTGDSRFLRRDFSWTSSQFTTDSFGE